MTHAGRILAFLEAHPGSTYEDITRGTGIGSPHRRITGKETPKGWTLRTEKRGKVFVHYAMRSSEVVGNVGQQAARAAGPPWTGTAAGDLERPHRSLRDVAENLVDLNIAPS